VKSITDATWKDAAIIEARSLVARLEDVAGKHATDPATLEHVTLESLTRQASKLADTIERIHEAPKKSAAAAALEALEALERKGDAEVKISPDGRRLLTQAIVLLKGGRS
jgi:leucyl-tRNA synthetase